VKREEVALGYPNSFSKTSFSRSDTLFAPKQRKQNSSQKKGEFSVSEKLNDNSRKSLGKKRKRGF